MSFYTNVFKRGNKIFARGIDDAGLPTMDEVLFKPALYLTTNDPSKREAVGLTGEDLICQNFDSINDFEEYLEKYKDVHGFRLFGSRNVVDQYIAKYYPGKIKYDLTKIRGAYIDLEVESGSFLIKPTAVAGEDGCYTTDDIESVKAGPFPEPVDSAYPITAATIYDSKTKIFFVLGLEVFKNDAGQKLRVGTYNHDKEHTKVGALKVMYKGFQTEEELLLYAITLLNKMTPNYLTGWNSDTFDVAYFVTRARMLVGESKPKEISPWGLVRQRTYHGNFGREEMTYDIYGVDLLDFKQLVEKHGFIELANKKLNTAAKHYLNEEKMSYDQSKGLSGLYFHKYQDYIAYNIQDVNLIVRMEAKLKFIGLSYSLAYMFHCNPGDTMSTVSPWSAMTYEKLHNRGQEPGFRPLYDGDIQFLGGYVEEPKPGLYKWVISIDAQSLDV